jgi:hypothetical protein
MSGSPCSQDRSAARSDWHASHSCLDRSKRCATPDGFQLSGDAVAQHREQQAFHNAETAARMPKTRNIQQAAAALRVTCMKIMRPEADLCLSGLAAC